MPRSEAQLCRHGRRLANVVGLDSPGGNERIRAFAQRISRQKLQLAQLVAPHRHRRHVITLNKNIAPK
jgi:hypothetical protein